MVKIIKNIYFFLKELNHNRKKKYKHVNEISIRNSIYNDLKKKSEAQGYSINYNTDNYLSRLCEKYGTDKGFVNFENETPYKWKPHTYSLFYHTLFSHCKDNIKLVFECGIGTNKSDVESNMSVNGKPGASLRVWKDYFINAEIFGADIDSRILFKEDRINTYQVNQLEPDSIKKMWSEIKKNNFDIIIDDGLHSFEAGFIFFKNSFDKLKKGGIYIIEDIDFSYIQKLKDALIEYNPEIILLTNNYFNIESVNDQNLHDNNLIIIRKN